MKPILSAIVLCSLLNIGFGQNAYFDHIPIGVVYGNDNERSGSCASPNGPIVCVELLSPPTFPYLSANGCCYLNSPAIKNATYCYTFTSIGTMVTLNCGFAVTTTGGYSYWFDNFYLYTCDPDCVAEPTYGTPYFTWTGLTPGQCYTFCFETHMTGGGATGGFNALCPYYIWDGVLPLTITSFTAELNSGKVDLAWEVAEEKNCLEYVIVRSTDGLNFEEIGVVPAFGNSASPRNYTFIDPNPAPGTAYYQIKQVDYDLRYGLSDIIACNSLETIISVRYYTYSGQVVDFDTAPPGIYIRETITNLSHYNKQIVKN